MAGDANNWTRHLVLITAADPAVRKHGSGFGLECASGVTFVVTCAHVVTDLGGSVRVNRLDAKVVFDGTAAGVDLAVLEVVGLTGVAPLRGGTSPAENNGAIVAVGFKRANQGFIVEPVRGTVDARIGLTFPDGSATRRDGYRLAFTSGRGIEPGYSGGPVIDPSTGRVIAVITMRQGDTVAYATSIDELRHWRKDAIATPTTLATPGAVAAAAPAVPAERTTPRFDAFVLHADASTDTVFVREELLPALGLPRDRVGLSSELPLGEPIVVALEKAIAACRFAIVVMSPAFLVDEWGVYGETLASHLTAMGGRLVPLKLIECELPKRIQMRVQLDCREVSNRPAALARLRALVNPQSTAVVAEPSPRSVSSRGKGMVQSASAHDMPRSPPSLIGRSAEREQASRALVGDGLVVLVGMPGIGKTYLARVVEADWRAISAAGVHYLIIDPADPASVTDIMHELAGQLGIEQEGQLDTHVHAALTTPTASLVVIENVDSEDAAIVVADLERKLPGVRMLVTARYETWSAPGSRWTSVELPLLTDKEARALLRVELGARSLTSADEDLLVERLQGVPLALHLAAGYLRQNYSAERFLSALEAARLALKTRSPADSSRGEREGGDLGALFDISRELLFRAAQRINADWAGAFAAICAAPLAGFGREFAAAVTGLDQDQYAIDVFLDAAVELSLVQRDEGAAGPRWSVHPMVATYGRAEDRGPIDSRIGGWITMAADEGEGDERDNVDRRSRWDALRRELPAVTEWLRIGRSDIVARVVAGALRFAEDVGPVAPWLEAARRGDPNVVSLGFLYTRARLASRVAAFEEAERCARTLRDRADAVGDEGSAALAEETIGSILFRRGDLEGAVKLFRAAHARSGRLKNAVMEATIAGTIADVLQAQGRLDEALRVRLEEELPALEMAGRRNDAATARLQIAGIHFSRKEWNAGLDLLRNEVIPSYSILANSRACADAQLQVVRVLTERVDPGDVEHAAEHAADLVEAEHLILEEVLPVYSHIGDPHAHAMARSTLARVLTARGKAGEALAILDEVEPVLKGLNARHDVAIVLNDRACALEALGRTDEAVELRIARVLPEFRELNDFESVAMVSRHIVRGLLARGESQRAGPFETIHLDAKRRVRDQKSGKGD